MPIGIETRGPRYENVFRTLFTRFLNDLPSLYFWGTLIKLLISHKIENMFLRFLTTLHFQDWPKPIILQNYTLANKL